MNRILLTNLIFQIALIIYAFFCALVEGDYSRGTFFLVLAYWFRTVVREDGPHN